MAMVKCHRCLRIATEADITKDGCTICRTAKVLSLSLDGAVTFYKDHHFMRIRPEDLSDEELDKLSFWAATELQDRERTYDEQNSRRVDARGTADRDASVSV